MYRSWIGSRVWCWRLPEGGKTQHTGGCQGGLTVLGEHCHHFQADILLLAELEVAETGDDLGDLFHHGADVLSQLVHGDGSAHHGCQAGLQGHKVGGDLLVGLGGGAVRVGGAQLLGAVDGLVGRGGEHQQLVPLVGEETGVEFHRNLLVEGQPPGPLDQLQDDPVADATQLVGEIRGRVVEEVSNVLRMDNEKDRETVMKSTRSVEMSSNSSQSMRSWMRRSASSYFSFLLARSESGPRRYWGNTWAIKHEEGWTGQDMTDLL